MAMTPHTAPTRIVTARQRVLAMLALAADLLLLVTVVVFLLNHGVELVIALVGLALAVSGCWWMVTEDRSRPGLGVVSASAGWSWGS
jgi:Flp pilus assembly protein TadB